MDVVEAMEGAGRKEMMDTLKVADEKEKEKKHAKEEIDGCMVCEEWKLTGAWCARSGKW